MCVLKCTTMFDDWILQSEVPGFLSARPEDGSRESINMEGLCNIFLA